MAVTYPNSYKERGYRMFLTDKDEYVPEDYYSITEIFSNKELALPGFSQEDWGIGEKRLKEMRRRTYENVKLRFNEVSGTYFNKYWNRNISSINQLGLNEFAKLSFFVELAAVMIAFEERLETKYMKGSKRKYISFGISKKNYEKYRTEKQKLIEASDYASRVCLTDRHIRLKNRESQKTTVLKFYSGGPEKPRCLIVAKNDVYLQFEDWCKKKGKSKADSLYKAMKMLMDSEPLEHEDIKINRPITDIEKEGHIDTDRESKQFEMHCYFKISLYNKICDIIYRYNMEAKADNKPCLTRNKFVNKAVLFYIKNLPLKYTNQETYNEYLKIKEAKKYNEKIQKSS